MQHIPTSLRIPIQISKRSIIRDLLSGKPRLEARPYLWIKARTNRPLRKRGRALLHKHSTLIIAVVRTNIKTTTSAVASSSVTSQCQVLITLQTLSIAMSPLLPSWWLWILRSKPKFKTSLWISTRILTLEPTTTTTTTEFTLRKSIITIPTQQSRVRSLEVVATQPRTKILILLTLVWKWALLPLNQPEVWIINSRPTQVIKACHILKTYQLLLLGWIVKTLSHCRNNYKAASRWC